MIKKGFVYLLHEFGDSPEYYKIGITKGTITERLKAIQTGNSKEVIIINYYHSKHYRKIESHFHRLYSKYRTEGGTEWFELPEEEVFKFKSICEEMDKIYSFLEETNEFFR